MDSLWKLSVAWDLIVAWVLLLWDTSFHPVMKGSVPFHILELVVLLDWDS